MYVCVCVFQVQQQQGSAVDTLFFLLPDLLHLPHPASRGKLILDFFKIIFITLNLNDLFALYIKKHVLFLSQIITMAVIVSFWYRKRADFHSFSSIRKFEASNLWSHNGGNQPEKQIPPERCTYLEKVESILF